MVEYGDCTIREGISIVLFMDVHAKNKLLTANFLGPYRSFSFSNIWVICDE